MGSYLSALWTQFISRFRQSTRCKSASHVSEEIKWKYETTNGLLLKIYSKKEGSGFDKRDSHGNYIYSDERTKTRMAIEKFLCTDILDYVKRKDPRFSGKVHGVGSCFAGVSVCSNEADLLFMLDIEGVLEEDKERLGYAKYRLSDQSLDYWKDVTTDDGYLMSRKLSTKFFFYVDEALKSGLHRKLPLLETGDIPTVHLSGLGTIATTLTVTYNVSVIIDVDLVLSINCKGLPSLATATWLKGNAEWPNSEIVSKIKESGYQLVPKAPYPLNDDEQSTIWRISFSLAETMLIQDLDTSIGTSAKLCYGLVKYFNLCFLAPRNRISTPVMKSYYLKIIWLFECQKYPDEMAWASDKFAERFLSIYQQVYNMIEEGKLPDFFMPSVNIVTCNFFGGIKTEVRRLLDDPVKTFEKWLYDERYSLFDMMIV